MNSDMNRKRNRMQSVICILCLMLCVSPMFNRTNVEAQTRKTVATKQVSLSRKRIRLIPKDTYQLTIKNAKGTVTYQSSKRSVATVSKKGKITAKANGKTVISAFVNGKEYSCVVVVSDTGISDAQVSVILGNTISLTMHTHIRKITWTSSDESVARVTKTGRVKTTGVGTCMITATVSGVKYKSEITVKKPSVILQSAEVGFRIVYSDGFMITAVEDSIDLSGYQTIALTCGYIEEISDALPIELDQLELDGLSDNAVFRPIMYEEYSAGLNSGYAEFVKSHDFFLNIKNQYRTKRAASGYVIFTDDSKVKKMKYNDGVHSCMIVL